MRNTRTHTAHTERDWSAMLRDIKLARQRLTGRCTQVELADFCGIPFSTMHNLFQSSVLQPLHSTGECIIAAYKKCYPEDSEF